MKKMKKLVSLLLAVVMVIAMTVATTVFAASENTTNITISGGATGSEYAAYKLLNVTDGGDGKYAYTVAAQYLAILQEITGKTTDTDIIDYISKLDAAGMRAFADAVYAKVKGMTADATTTTNMFGNVPQGYYLIAETKVGNSTDTYSLVMLNTAGNAETTVTTKEDVPELEKKVQEKNDSTGVISDWQDGADYDIGDAVPFKLTGTVSSKYADYKTYYYAFHDKMSAGLTFDPGSVVVKVDNDTVEGGYTVVTEGLTDGCTFEVQFTDLKTITGATVNANSKITVEFTATLNNQAVLGSAGNPNEAKLEYNNNPYATEKPTTPGETPWDKVIVFTYKLVADKVDGTGASLEGAGFTLYKFDNETGDYVAVGNEITGVTTFTFTGLDAGQYKLVESTVPAGYNKAEDILFTVEATYDTDSADPQLTGLVVKDDKGNTISSGEGAVFTTKVTDGSVNTKVENLSGTELPETGGMGTTIFYVVGSILVLGAAILLITRKRMSSGK